MSRLVNLGPGEICDRLTILMLKILYARQAGKPVEHFEQERNALLVMLRGRELNAGWFEQVLGLGSVNAALWQEEDALRDLRPKKDPLPPWDPVVTARDIAFRIQELNDTRAALIEAINKLTGDHLGAEKLL